MHWTGSVVHIHIVLKKHSNQTDFKLQINCYQNSKVLARYIELVITRDKCTINF